MKNKIVILVILLIMYAQGCWAGDIKESKEKPIVLGESELTKDSGKASYRFNKFYADTDMSKLNYSETDKQVCNDLPKVLNETDAGPMVCIIKFPKNSHFENIEWSEMGKNKSLQMEKLRMGRTQKAWCGIASVDGKIHEKTAASIDSGNTFFQTTEVDVDNNGEPDSLLKRIWSDQYCDAEKEYGHPVAVHLLYGCLDEKSQPVDLKEIHSLDVFKYKDKYYLFSWQGIKTPENPVKGYININEYVANESRALDGVFVSHWVRQLCRINYQ